MWCIRFFVDEKGQQGVEGEVREKAKMLLRKEIIDLPYEIYSCLSEMKEIFDRLVKDEAKKTEEGMNVVSYKDIFKTAAKIKASIT